MTSPALSPYSFKAWTECKVTDADHSHFEQVGLIVGFERDAARNITQVEVKFYPYWKTEAYWFTPDQVETVCR